MCALLACALAESLESRRVPSVPWLCTGAAVGRQCVTGAAAGGLGADFCGRRGHWRGLTLLPRLSAGTNTRALGVPAGALAG